MNRTTVKKEFDQPQTVSQLKANMEYWRSVWKVAEAITQSAFEKYRYLQTQVMANKQEKTINDDT